MKKLISFILCAVLCVTAAFAETAPERRIPDPLPLTDYQAAFTDLATAMGMPTEMFSWEANPENSIHIQLKMQEDLLATVLTVDGETVSAVFVSYRDFPGEDTALMLRMLSLMSAGPAAMAAGATFEEASATALEGVFAKMPENWYNGENIAYRTEVYGAPMLISVIPKEDGSYMHSLLLFVSDEEAEKYVLEPPEGKATAASVASVTFPTPVKMADYLAAFDQVLAELPQVGTICWVQDEANPAIWSIESSGEPFGMMIRAVNGDIMVLGAQCTEEAAWANATLEIQVMLAVTPLAVLSGMSAEEALAWWKSGEAYQPFSSVGTDVARHEFYCGVPMHLTIETQENGMRHHELLLLFYEGAETTLPMNGTVSK